MVPEMSARGYKKKMSIGPILGTGGLAIIIPPSALAVLLATLAQIDVGALLIAGVVPGLILAGLYIMAIFFMTRMDPSAAPAYEVPRLSLGAKLALVMTDVVPMVGLMVVIVTLMIIGSPHLLKQPHWRLGCDPAVDCLPVFHLGGYEKVDPWRAACHADGLSDCLRFSDLLANLGFLRGLARFDWLGDRF